MFGKLFGKKKKVSKEEEKQIAQKKNDLKLKQAQQNHQQAIEKNELKIKKLEAEINQKQKEALAAKKSGNKTKALTILGRVKNLKKQLGQIYNYNTLLMQQMNGIDSASIDREMADNISKVNDVLKQQQQNQEENLDVIQDAIQLNQEMQYNQDEINDLLNQQNQEFNEGLEDEFNQLDELDILDATDNYQQDTNNNQNKNVSKKKDENNFDSMLEDFLT